jgi:hypothetical protein
MKITAKIDKFHNRIYLQLISDNDSHWITYFLHGKILFMYKIVQLGGI